MFKFAYLAVECCNIVDDRLGQPPDELEDNLVARLLAGDIHKSVEMVFHIETGQDATLKLPKEPRNPFGL